VTGWHSVEAKKTIQKIETQGSGEDVPPKGIGKEKKKTVPRCCEKNKEAGKTEMSENA